MARQPADRYESGRALADDIEHWLADEPVSAYRESSWEQTKRLCRTFSDCTTAPRNGLVSGCYPLDAFYKKSPEMKLLAAAKKAQVA